MADQPLFRQEALDAQTTHSLGTIRLAQPVAHRAAAAIALAITGLIVAFALFGSYTRRASVPGLLEPVGGTLHLTAAATGVVTAMRVVEGQSVRAGDVLFALSGERVSAGGQTEASIALQLDSRAAALEHDLRLVAERDALRTRTAQERLAAIDAESSRLAHETSIQAARQRIAEKNVERFDELARTGFIAPLQAQARQDDLLVLQAASDNYVRQATGLARERAGLLGQLGDSRLQAAAERTELERLRATLAQERIETEARRSMVVVAPHDGSVTGIAAHTGQRVGPGALLATLLPADTELAAQLFASTRQAGFVEPGQRVRLRYAAYPYQKFGMGEGVVASIEKSPYALQELPSQVAATLGVSALQGVEPVYRIVVRLDRQTIRTYGQDQALRAGMVFEADIIEDRRRLIEWLLEPIYGIAGR